jgi:adhesin transport system membrane fusion protein
VAWAAVAEIDEITRGEARVIPSSQLQIIQAVDGGVVEELAVREGQVVEAGALLLSVDPTRFVSSLRENRATFLSLQAKAARLQALTQGIAFEVPAEVLEEVPEVAAHEQRLYLSSVAEMDAQLSIARQQLTQRQQELNEMRSRHAQATRGYELTVQELNVTRPLIESGAVSEVDLLRLERDVSRLRGERDQSAAQISRIQSAIAEATRKIQEVELNVRNQMRNELSDTMAKLGSLSEGSRSLADKVKHAEIRSPVRGTVKRLLVNTVGGVVQPGKEVVEIVPLDDALILEAKVTPKDIAFLHPGQAALVKFTAYDFAIYGGLEAVVDNIGADSVIDDKGNAFYIVRVRTHKASLGDKLPIIPGMVAEVDILTGKKTILSYLLKPVLRAKAKALSER